MCDVCWFSGGNGIISLDFVGVQLIDSVAQVLLSTHMFVGGLIGFVLDNTIPGKLIIFN